MESVGSPEEEVKFNTPVLASYLNSCNIPTLLQEARKPAAVISVASDNSGSELNNNTVTEKEDCDDGSVKPYSPSGM